MLSAVADNFVVRCCERLIPTVAGGFAITEKYRNGNRIGSAISYSEERNRGPAVLGKKMPDVGGKGKERPCYNIFS